jgi:signal transduction histidine kinase/CheY-like chemotaxis protein
MTGDTGTYPAGTERRDPRQAQARQRLEELVALRTAELAAAKEAAEAALAAKSAFLARMSHEIRTPMNTIIGLNHIMLRDVSDPRLRAQIDKVLGAAEHLLALIDDILDLSRIEAGQVTLAATDFAPRQVVDGVLGLVLSQAEARHLELSVDVAPDVPSVLRGDAHRLRQVLLHFASNAVKFTERGSVKFHVRTVGRRGDDVVVRFAVSDTGIGLAEEHRRRVFHVFEQGEGGATRRFGGAGLGLALCLRLAQLMRGDVGVHSQLGRGSTFWFEAPFAAGAALPAEPEQDATVEDTGVHASPADPSNRRVLLVDDNELNLEVAQTFLKLDGYEIDLARDGEEAVAMARRRSYRAMLIDVQMPRMDGIEATRVLRSFARHVATPIIAMTASAFEEDRRVCLEAGMNDLVAKPVEPALLSRVMRRWAPIAASSAAAQEAGPAAAQVAAPTSAAATGDARASLQGLQELVATDDLRARDFFRKMPREAAGSRHAELGRLLETFDYGRAHALIEALLQGG